MKLFPCYWFSETEYNLACALCFLQFVFQLHSTNINFTSYTLYCIYIPILFTAVNFLFFYRHSVPRFHVKSLTNELIQIEIRSPAVFYPVLPLETLSPGCSAESITLVKKKHAHAHTHARVFAQIMTIIIVTLLFSSNDVCMISYHISERNWAFKINT